jgi:hypothetical protein
MNIGWYPFFRIWIPPGAVRILSLWGIYFPGLWHSLRGAYLLLAGMILLSRVAPAAPAGIIGG